MAYCHEHGIPHSVFLEWEPSDRAKMLAHAMEKSLACPSCGTAGWEWDPAAGGDLSAYEALQIRCEGCARKDLARELSDGGKVPGEHLQLVPRAVAEKMQQTRHKRPWSKREQAKARRRR